MRKDILILLFFNSIYSICFAQAPNWLWAKSSNNTGFVRAFSVAVDVSGNSYVTGYFESSIVNFGPFSLSNAGYVDLFLEKYDVAGNVLWAKSAGGTNLDDAYSVVVDVSGNSYVTGRSYSLTMRFDTITLTTTDANPVYLFLAKYDASGNALWAKKIGGEDDDAPPSVATDFFGNAYMTGGFVSDTLIVDQDTLINNGYENIFIVKYNASGNVVWARSAGGTGVEKANSIAVDTFGNAYVAGHFLDQNVVFGSDTLTNWDSSYKLFLAKYDALGNALWARSAIGALSYGGPSVAVDAVGNVYVSGSFFEGAMTFDFITIGNYGHDDMFLAKYNAAGYIQWANSAGGSDYDRAYSVVVDASGNSYVTGAYSSDKLIADDDTLANLSAPNSDIFLVKYNELGNEVWAKCVGGTENDIGYSLAMNASGNLYIAGCYNSPTLAFCYASFLSSAQEYEMFLAKLDTSIFSGINEINDRFFTSLSPNPAINQITLETDKKATIEIFNIEGQQIISLIADGIETSIDISDFARGMYFVKVMTGKEFSVRKFVKL